jgi:hypothetical protein
LLNTGEHDWVDPVTGLDDSGDSPGDAGFLSSREDWDRVVDYGNSELDYIMMYKWQGDPDAIPAIPPGNDNLLILEQQ